VRRESREPDKDLERETASLRLQITHLEEEAAVLRRRLGDPGDQARILEEKLAENRARLTTALSQNERLAETLKEVREQIIALKEEVEKLSQPPSGFGVFLALNEDGTVDVSTGGRKLRVNVANEIDPKSLVRGQELMLNEAMNVIAARAFEAQGEVVKLKEVLDAERAIVVAHADEEKVVLLADPLMGQSIRAGDHLMLDTRSGYVYERLPKADVEELVLEEVPDITYENIGGLSGQIEAIRDAVELPFLHQELFVEHELKPPKGVLLYGPPGCGKTLIAKAVANSLAKRMREKAAESNENAKAYFLNIKGPELLNKYVGETERQIRQIFQRAKEKSDEGFPVIVFFDEMDSLFRTRGTGVSSDVENTIVPQLLAEIDGVETLSNVIVIGASNREDMIDPAILRPGRLDVKIKIERPDATGAKEIFGIYLTPTLPLNQKELEQAGSREVLLEQMIEQTVERMYSADETNRFLEVTYANGDKEVLYFKDFNSGAMIENVVARAKKDAIKRYLETGEKGLRTEDLFQAIRDEFKENEDLPNTTNPDDWARISGKKGERIVYVRTLISHGEEGKSKSIENVATGQYL
jgi:proteasome-associated ATPase